jgi:LSD1 subclass zinc finger protein
MLIFCPSCRRQLRVPDESAGKQAQCPSCQTIFTADSATTGEAIQTPPAPLPSAPRQFDAVEDDDRLPRPPYERDEQDDEPIHAGDHEEAQRRAGAAARWFYIAVAGALLLFVAGIILAFAAGRVAQLPFAGPERDLAFVFIVFTIAGCGVVHIAIAVFLVIAGIKLKSMTGKGWVIAGIVLAFVQALLFGVSLLTNLILLLTNLDEALGKWMPLDATFDATAIFVNCMAAIKAIMALQNAAVSAEFERHRPRFWPRPDWQD